MINGWRARWQRIDWNSDKIAQRACIAVPILCGLWSLWLGVDSNWDLFNYHLYNAFALLHGKLAIDFAPAGIQTYFNPLLDLFYYGLLHALPARLVGFVMGAVHGLNFVLLLIVTRAALAGLPDADRVRVPLWLALAGCLTANFLSVLGNSMGDDLTSLFVLAALAIVLRGWASVAAMSAHGIRVIVLAGGIVGAGAGLKLTNAVYAVALCAGFIVLPSGWWTRMRAAFVFGISVLPGLAATGGFWFAKMWTMFGNPVFPQFTSVFPNPYVATVGVIDAQWPPKTLVETLLWPFILTLDPHRVGQTEIYQILWPLLYVSFAAWGVSLLAYGRQRLAISAASPAGVTTSTMQARVARDVPLDTCARFVLVFIAVGFIVWMKLFSIFRYIIPIEMCAPLAVFIVLTRLFNYTQARRVAVWTLSIAGAVVVCGGTKTWGHERWAEPAYRAEVPALPSPATTTAVIIGGDPPWAWLTTFFPPEVAFVGLSGNFPQTPAYDAHAKQIIAKRGGPVYVIVKANYNGRLDSISRAGAIVRALRLTRSERGCTLLRGIVARLHLHASVRSVPNAHGYEQCTLGLNAADEVDTVAQDRAAVAEAAGLLKHYGLTVSPTDCSVYHAYAGLKPRYYQWCRMSFIRPYDGLRMD